MALEPARHPSIAAPLPKTTPTAATVTGAQVLIPLAALNLPFVLALLLPHQLPAAGMALVVGLVLFVCPGLAWADLRGEDGFETFVRMVLTSTAASVLAWMALAALPGPTSRPGFILALAGVTNLGLWQGLRSGRLGAQRATSPLWLPLTFVCALFLVQSYVGAAHRIPALEDQDMETQGTAYGMMHAGEPAMVTNRNSAFFFAHPPLLHFWIGASALVSDDLERLRYYYEASLRARRPDGGDLMAIFDDEFVQFERDPVLLPSRTPNLFLGVFVLLPLAFIVFGATGSVTAAIGTCAMYFTMPEIYVRSAYGGYMAAANFVTLSGAYFYLRQVGLLPFASASGRGGALAGTLAFVGAWTDQKTMLFAGAAGVHAFGRVVIDGLTGGLRAIPWRQFGTAVVLAVAFVAGWACFAAYGWLIAASDFVTDHFRTHVAERVDLATISLDTIWVRKGKYLSVLGLWNQFFTHAGWIVAAGILAATAWAVRHVRGAAGYFLVWALVGGVGFSFVDWRITKHLAQVLPAMLVLVGMCWAAAPPRLQAVTGALVALAVGWNIWRVLQMMADFTYLAPTPLW